MSVRFIDDRYINGKIYKLTFSDTEKNYYGSTIEDLSTRLTKHNEKYQNRYLKNRGYECNNSKPRVFAYYPLLNEGHKITSIKLVENYSCDNRMELENREIDIINQDENALNTDRKKRDTTNLYKCDCGIVIVNGNNNVKAHWKTKRHVDRMIKINGEQN